MTTALLVLFMGAPAQAEWQIKEFEAVFEEPSLNDVNVVRDENETPWSADDLSRVIKPPLSDPDDDGRALLIETQLRDIADAYSKAGLPEPTHLEKSIDGERYVVRIFHWSPLNKTVNQGSSSDAAGMTTAIDCSGKKGWIWINKSYFWPLDGRLYWPGGGDMFYPVHEHARAQIEADDRQFFERYLFDTLAHELFHAVQNQYIENASANSCNRYPSDAWTEGTADAVSFYMLEKRYPAFAMKLQANSGAKKARGEYPYNNAWTKAFTGSRKLSPYWVSSLFRLALERYEGNYKLPEGYSGISVMGEMFAASKPPLGSLSQVEWFNNGLKRVNQKMPLPLHFSEFVAHHADAFGRYAQDQAKWLEASFEECETVDLEPETTPAQSFKNVVMDHHAAKCFIIRVKKEPDDRCVYVNVIARSPKLVGIDSLHLSAAELGGTINGRERWCWQDSLSGNKPQCVVKPLTGRPKKQSDPQSNEDTWVRTWYAPQQVSDNGEILNIFLLSYQSDVDKYNAQRNNKAPDWFAADVDIAISRSRMQKNGKAVECPSSSVNTPGNGEGGAPSAKGSKPEFGTQVSTMSPFGINSMVGQDLMDDGQGGIRMLHLNDLVDGTDAADSDYLESFRFVVEKPIQFGATGQYPAFIGGNTENDLIMNVGDKPSATLTVIQFDDALLNVRVNGRYCKLSNMTPKGKCRKVETIEGDIIKAFGWTYDMAQTLVSMDTPGMQMYRRLFDDILGPGSSNDPMLPIPIPGNIGAPPTSGNDAGPADASSSGGTQACDCSCESISAMRADMDAYAETADKLPEGTMPSFSSLPMGAMNCLMQCLPAMEACE